MNDLAKKNDKVIFTIVFGKVFDLITFPDVSNDLVIVWVKLSFTCNVVNEAEKVVVSFVVVFLNVSKCINDL